MGNGNKFFTFHFSLFTFFRTFAPQIGLVAQLVRATDFGLVAQLVRATDS